MHVCARAINDSRILTTKKEQEENGKKKKKNEKMALYNLRVQNRALLHFNWTSTTRYVQKRSMELTKTKIEGKKTEKRRMTKNVIYLWPLWKPHLHICIVIAICVLLAAFFSALRSHTHAFVSFRFTVHGCSSKNNRNQFGYICEKSKTCVCSVGVFTIY